jgi:hypothetical protein
VSTHFIGRNPISKRRKHASSQPVQVDRLPPDLNVAAMAAIAETLTLSEARYLRGPLIQPRLNGWDFPDRLRPIVPLARWLQVLRGRHDERETDLASDEEAIGYISCVSLDAPLDRDWAEIFFYLGQQVFPRWNLINGQAVHSALGLDRPIVLHDQQIADLTRFRRWLRRKVEEGAKRSHSAKRNPRSRSSI